MLINERILLGLRSGGVALETLAEAGVNGREGGPGDVVRALVEEGLAESDRNILRLTRRGFLVCDEIARRLMVG
jgi:coproporphyrinogen III oxidase-like Fe-S oxidoreductase